MLYVQHYGDGGSMVSLLGLIQGLDRTRFTPVVTFRSDNPFVADFEAAGATVEVLRGLAPPTEPRPGDEHGSTGAPARPLPSRRFSTLRREARRFLRRDLPATRQLLRVARRHDVDLVHANNDVRSNRDAVAVAALRRLPLVAHVRNLERFAPDLGLRIDRMVARRVDHFVCISRAVAAATEAAFEIRSGDASVIDNPFDTAAYRRAASPTTAESLGVPADAKVVLHIGRIVRWKGQDALLRAMVPVVAADPATVAVLVGTPTGRRGAAFERELRDLAVELGIAEHVVFAGPRRDVPEVLALADVVVHCSTAAEPSGRVVVEAMAAGRPVIGADAGGTSELIDHGRTGLLVRPGDPTSLGAALTALLDDPVAASAMAVAGQEAVDARFSIEGHARAVEAIYDRLGSRRRAARNGA